MVYKIDNRSGVPIYRQIIDQVREQIMFGLLKEGDQLMSVKDLSAKLSINPMTVSKAYTIMETEGLVERRRGIGLFIAEIESNKKEKNQGELVESLLYKAIVTASQFGLSKKNVLKVIDDLYEKHQPDKRSMSNE